MAVPFKNPMITYQKAQDIIRALAKSFGHEEVALDDALGRVLTEAVGADRDYPPFNRAAMDGYAFHSRDWEKGLRDFIVQEVIYAGQSFTDNLKPGACYKIMTGAAVPPSANAIIRREDAQEEQGRVRLIADAVKPYMNIARKGEDIRKSEVIIPAQTLCNASVTSSLAAVGKHKLLVEKLPKLALFTTGDEVMPIDAPVSEIQIRNSNQHLLKGLLNKWHIKPSLCKHIPDTKNDLTETLRQAMNLDMIVMCGGVSAGDADYVPQVLEELGVEKLFHKVAIKPGKPVFCGKLPGGGIVFALPGNPFSCLVAFTLFIETYFYYCFGLQNQPVYHFPILKTRGKKHKLTEFFAARINQGTPGVTPISVNGSGDIRAGLAAHGLGVHPHDQEELEQNTNIQFIPFMNSLI
ncbi:molybdopterin molybdotransferase MoeA [Pontibacter silvestris]|uniref:Molybdopterin molybdenumtransferase n=1 Tax=Pontibacter silvestris TaxID=2305183 RepID=A0ABW4X0Y7_9BACT|nr:molybdopterin molybdotransferase MoeA [Pontibacter silvestris]MCC9137472.1 molybdopterin molybdotransferase MoeA [Pontibacter silvestris]